MFLPSIDMNRKLRRVSSYFQQSFARPMQICRWSLNWWKVWKSYPIFDWIYGADCFKKGDFRAARKHYERGIARHPSHRAVYCARLDYAYCLYRLGELPKAAAELARLTGVSTPLKDTFLLLAKIQVLMGDYPSAVLTLRRALYVFPNESQIIIQFANTVIAAKGPAKYINDVRFQLETLREQLSLTDPKMTALEGAIACFELRFGDHPRGEQLLSRVLASGAAPYETLLIRSEMMLEEGMVVPARGLLTRAMSLGPSDPRPLILLAKSYLLSGDFFEPQYAVQLATNANQLGVWQNPDALTTLIDAHTAAGNADAAELLTEQLRFITSARQLNLEQIRDAGRQIQLLRTVQEQSVKSSST